MPLSWYSVKQGGWPVVPPCQLDSDWGFSWRWVYFSGRKGSRWPRPVLWIGDSCEPLAAQLEHGYQGLGKEIQAGILSSFSTHL